jgi:hypothetical protein
MLKTMRIMEPLAITATTGIMVAIIAFVVAWQSQSHLGAILRQQLRFLGWLALGIPQALAGMIVGLGAMLLSPMHPRINAYRRIRAHQPRHAYVYGMD